MSTYTAPCRVSGCRWMPVRRHSRQDAVTALPTHTRAEHPNENGGAVGRPHHTNHTDRKGKAVAMSIPTGAAAREYIQGRVAVDPETGCWLWGGEVSRSGYGVFRRWDDGKRFARLAHRAAYEAFVGPIPDGLHIDHLCHSNDSTCPGGVCDHRRCCNPAHLEPVTVHENNRRGNGAGALAVRTNQCLRGHEFDEANTQIRRDKTRICRACARYRTQKSLARRAAKAAI